MKTVSSHSALVIVLALIFNSACTRIVGQRQNYTAAPANPDSTVLQQLASTDPTFQAELDALKAEDLKLWAAIDQLRIQLKALGDSTDSRIADLQKTDAQIQKDLVDQKSATDTAIADLDKKLTGELEAIKVTLAAQGTTLSNLISLHEADLKTQIEQLRDELLKKITDNQSLTAAQIADLTLQTMDQFKDISDTLSGLQKSLEDFQAYANSNFATKAELKLISDAVGSLTGTVDLLAGRVAASEAALTATKNELATTKAELTAATDRLAKTELNVEAVSQSLTALDLSVQNALTAQSQKMDLVFQQLGNNIADLRNEFLTLLGQSEANLQAVLEAKITDLANQIAANKSEMNLALATALTEANQKIAAIDANTSATDAEVKALQDQLLATKADIAQEIADRGAQVDELRVAIDSLKTELASVKATAEAALVMSKQNATDAIATNQNFTQFTKDTISRFAAVDSSITGLEAKIAAGVTDAKAYADQKRDEAILAAKNAMAAYGKDMQNEFAAQVARLDDLYREESANYNTLRAEVAAVTQSQTRVEEITTLVAGNDEELTTLLNQIQQQFTQFLTSVVAVLQPKPGDALDLAWKNAPTGCKVETVTFQQALGVDGFVLIAQSLLQSFVYNHGDRAVLAPYTQGFGGDTLEAFVRTTLVPFAVPTNDKNCDPNTLRAFALNILSQNTALTNALAADPTFKRAKESINEILKKLSPVLSAIEGKINQAVGPSANQRKEIYARAANSFAAKAAIQDNIKTLQYAINQTITNITNNPPAIDPQVLAEIQKNIVDLNAAILAMKDRYDQMFNLAFSKIDKVTESVKRALDILLTMAERNPIYEDLITYVYAAGKPIDYVPSPIKGACTNPTIANLNFGYKKLVGNPCNLGDNKFYWKFGEGPSPWSNQCTINYRNNPGAVQNTASSFVALLQGTMNKIQTKIAAETPVNVVPGANFETFGPFINGLFKWHGGTQFTNYFKTQTLTQGALNVSITPMCGTIKGTQKTMALNFYSPIVLDFHRHGRPNTLPLQAQTEFDLLGRGHKLQTGWIDAVEAGFLVLDRDQDGAISDGQELFGETTRLKSGRKARNGYLALQEFDDNGDGKIDAADAVFNRLQVWFDSSNYGVTESGELRSLQELNVTSIDLHYRRVPKSQRLDTSGNQFVYRSRFFGPDSCGQSGCRSYDVYFNTLSVN